VKILVPVKRVPDPTQKAKIKDGHIDLTGATWIVNTFDEYAIETALRLVENGADNTRLPGGEIVVVSLGPNDAAKEIRTCLAMGADRAIHVAANDAEIDALIVVKVLSAIVAAEKPDVVIMGKQAVDGDANQVGQMLAAKLGWPQATFAASIELGADKASFTVGREVDGGVEYKKVPLHSVITVDLRIVGPRAVKNGVTPESHNYSGEGARLPSLKGIMAAKKKPLEVKPVTLAAGSTTVLGLTPPEERKAGRIVGEGPEAVVELVKLLRFEAKVI